MDVAVWPACKSRTVWLACRSGPCGRPANRDRARARLPLPTGARLARATISHRLFAGKHRAGVPPPPRPAPPSLSLPSRAGGRATAAPLTYPCRRTNAELRQHSARREEAAGGRPPRRLSSRAASSGASRYRRDGSGVPPTRPAHAQCRAAPRPQGCSSTGHPFPTRQISPARARATGFASRNRPARAIQAACASRSRSRPYRHGARAPRHRHGARSGGNAALQRNRPAPRRASPASPPAAARPSPPVAAASQPRSARLRLTSNAPRPRPSRSRPRSGRRTGRPPGTASAPARTVRASAPTPPPPPPPPPPAPRRWRRGRRGRGGDGRGSSWTRRCGRSSPVPLFSIPPSISLSPSLSLPPSLKAAARRRDRDVTLSSRRPIGRRLFGRSRSNSAWAWSNSAWNWSNSARNWSNSARSNRCGLLDGRHASPCSPCLTTDPQCVTTDQSCQIWAAT